MSHMRVKSTENVLVPSKEVVSEMQNASKSILPSESIHGILSNEKTIIPEKLADSIKSYVEQVRCVPSVQFEKQLSEIERKQMVNAAKKDFNLALDILKCPRNIVCHAKHLGLDRMQLTDIITSFSPEKYYFENESLSHYQTLIQDLCNQAWDGRYDWTFPTIDAVYAVRNLVRHFGLAQNGMWRNPVHPLLKKSDDIARILYFQSRGIFDTHSGLATNENLVALSKLSSTNEGFIQSWLNVRKVCKQVSDSITSKESTYAKSTAGYLSFLWKNNEEDQLFVPNQDRANSILFIRHAVRFDLHRPTLSPLTILSELKSTLEREKRKTETQQSEQWSATLFNKKSTLAIHIEEILALPEFKHDLESCAEREKEEDDKESQAAVKRCGNL